MADNDFEFDEDDMAAWGGRDRDGWSSDPTGRGGSGRGGEGTDEKRDVFGFTKKEKERHSRLVDELEEKERQRVSKLPEDRRDAHLGVIAQMYGRDDPHGFEEEPDYGEFYTKPFDPELDKEGVLKPLDTIPLYEPDKLGLKGISETQRRINFLYGKRHPKGKSHLRVKAELTAKLNSLKKDFNRPGAMTRQKVDVYQKTFDKLNELKEQERNALDILGKQGGITAGGYHEKQTPDWVLQNKGVLTRNFGGVLGILGVLPQYRFLEEATRPGTFAQHWKEQQRVEDLPDDWSAGFKRKPKRRKKPVCPPGVPWFFCPPGSSRGKTSKRKAQGGLVELAEGGPVNFAQGDLVKTNNDNNMEISDMVGRTTNTPDFKNTIKTSIDALNNFGLTGRTMVGAEEEEGIGIPTDIPTDVASMDVDETENDYMNMFAETIDPSTGETEVADYAEDEEFEETPGGGLTEIAGAEEIDEETFGGGGGLPVMGARGGGYVDSPTGGLDDLVPAYIESGEIPRYSRGTMGGGGGLSNYLSSRHLDRHLPQITPEGRQAARLSGGEFVVPADAVADAGGGNSRNGALQFTNLIKNIRLQKHGTTKQPSKLPSSVSGLMGLA